MVDLIFTLPIFEALEFCYNLRFRIEVYLFLHDLITFLQIWIIYIDINVREISTEKIARQINKITEMNYLFIVRSCECERKERTQKKQSKMKKNKEYIIINIAIIRFIICLCIAIQIKRNDKSDNANKNICNL